MQSPPKNCLKQQFHTLGLTETLDKRLSWCLSIDFVRAIHFISIFPLSFRNRSRTRSQPSKQIVKNSLKKMTNFKRRTNTSRLFSPIVTRFPTTGYKKKIINMQSESKNWNRRTDNILMKSTNFMKNDKLSSPVSCICNLLKLKMLSGRPHVAVLFVRENLWRISIQLPMFEPWSRR